MRVNLKPASTSWTDPVPGSPRRQKVRIARSDASLIENEVSAEKGKAQSFRARQVFDAIIRRESRRTQVKYFADTDTALVEYTENEVAQAEEISENIYVDLNSQGNLVSMTIEHARTNARPQEFSYQEVAGRVWGHAELGTAQRTGPASLSPTGERPPRLSAGAPKPFRQAWRKDARGVLHGSLPAAWRHEAVGVSGRSVLGPLARPITWLEPPPR